MGGGAAVLLGAAALYLTAPHDAPARVALSIAHRSSSVGVTLRW
jgi:hypothetical protein